MDVRLGVATAAPQRPSRIRNGGAMVLALGGALIVLGWWVPWGAAGGTSVSGLSEVIAPWFRVLLLGSGLVALVSGGLAAFRSARWGMVAAAVAVVAWSLIFPAVVYLGARSVAGLGDVPAATGPQVGYRPGAYLVAAGAVAVVLGCGPAVTGRRWVRVATSLAAVAVGASLILGLSG